MSFLQLPPESDGEPAVFAVYRERLGFVPNFIRAQGCRPRIVEAEAELARSILFLPSALSQLQKEYLVLAVASHLRSTYVVTTHAKIIADLGAPASTILALTRDYRDAGLDPRDLALVEFALKLARHPTWMDRHDFVSLREHGLTEEQILEAVITVGIARFVSALSLGLGLTPDFDPIDPSPDPGALPRDAGPRAEALDEERRGYFPALAAGDGAERVLEFFKERYGFVARVYREQAFRPDILQAEANLYDAVVVATDALSRVQKEFILLAVAASNLNSYFVGVISEVLRGLGVPLEIADQIALDHRAAGLTAADAALLDAALLLARSPERFGAEAIAGLRSHGFTDPQILEGLSTAALAQFLTTIQTGLGSVPDFPVRFEFPREAPGISTAEGNISGSVNPGAGVAHPTIEGVEDPDAEPVARIRSGDIGAFEAIVKRHGGRLLRTLTGITGNAADAEDALQSAFLKAYQSLGEFQGEARFGTWLTRIALNEGLQRVRARKPVESLDEGRDDAEEFRPRLILPWHENPETIFTEEERRALVAAAVAALPEKYRVVVVLRDMEQLSTEEASAALGLPVPTMKTRLLRGRLLLREALAPHFVVRPGRSR